MYKVPNIYAISDVVKPENHGLYCYNLWQMLISKSSVAAKYGI